MAKPKERGDGTGSVYRRGDGQWVAQVRRFDPLTGTSVKTRRYATSREAARAKLKQLRDGTTPATTTGPDVLLADYFSTWRTHRLPHTSLSPRTQTIYGDLLRWYGEPAAGRLRLRDLDRRTGELWLAAVRDHRRKDGQPLAASTVRGVYVAAVRALDLAADEGLTEGNPLRQVDRPTVTKATVPVTSADDADALLAACQGRRIEHLAVFVAFTGVRIGEALALRWSDVDLSAGTATIRRGSPDRDATKSGRVRTITCIPEVVDALRAQRQRQRSDAADLGPSWANPDGLVFTSITGRALDRRNVTHELQRAARAAKVNPARPWHSLRHGLAHRLLARGVPLQVVSALLGHSGIGITADTYGHVSAIVPADVLSAALNRDTDG